MNDKLNKFDKDGVILKESLEVAMIQKKFSAIEVIKSKNVTNVERCLKETVIWKTTRKTIILISFTSVMFVEKQIISKGD